MANKQRISQLTGETSPTDNDDTPAYSAMEVMAMASRGPAMDDTDFNDLVVVDDGEGFKYVVVAKGAVYRGTAESTETTKFGETLVFRASHNCMATTNVDDVKTALEVPAGTPVRLGHRMALQPVFDMVEAGLNPSFEIIFLDKISLVNGNTMWRVQVAIGQKFLKQMRELTSKAPAKRVAK